LLIARAEQALKSYGRFDGQLEITDAVDVTIDTYEWLWPNRFALGKLGLIVGLPDEGKGQVLCYLAAQVSKGGIWPCGEGLAPKGNVLMLSAEDAPNDTVVPPFDRSRRQSKPYQDYEYCASADWRAHVQLVHRSRHAAREDYRNW
jgi:hypothetical protein